MGAPSPSIGGFLSPFEGGGVMLRWHEWGPADGRPVVCVHGLTRNGRDFDVLAAALAAEGRRVLCLDVPGRGISAWLPLGTQYIVPVYVGLIAPLLASLGEYDWVGTSMGGLIGMGLAGLPGPGPRRMVLNDIGPFVPVASLERIRDYLSQPPVEFTALEQVEAYLRRVHAPFGPLTDAEWRHMATHSAHRTPGGGWRLHYDPRIVEPMGMGPLADVDLWALWPWVSARPTLVIRGESSDLLLPGTARQMAEPETVTLATIPGCGHAPALMEAGQVRLIQDFLR
ncbi:alpha/beta fold hydrolase [Rhodovarius lipocyclicus]|uniref:alpha/beta fold hydrolase n=1 Tax=Rhodovarius lipocyclicus TaxID=268410 RepID=UPI00135785DD|nr:alpha/beta hydrolase [Rhodovarius lipocyclicus]